jgi:hypothetical protein
MARSGHMKDSENAEGPHVTEPLSRDEDALLRRLHWFESLGVELSPERRELLTSIRARDKRTVIRDPGDVVVEEPVEPEDEDEV